MSNRIIDFPTGIAFHTQPENSEFFRQLKKMLRTLNVAYNDECCGDSFCPINPPICTVQQDVDSFVYTRTVASTTWTISHNLDFYPNVQVIASNGTNVMGDIQYIDTNNLVIQFSQAYSGTAYLS